MTKTEFNKQFSLELDYKFVGLNRIEELGLTDLFWHKFSRMVDNMKPYLAHSNKVYRSIPFRLHGHSIKLYYR